jgi:hypothetical protein
MYSCEDSSEEICTDVSHIPRTFCHILRTLILAYRPDSITEIRQDLLREIIKTIAIWQDLLREIQKDRTSSEKLLKL